MNEQARLRSIIVHTLAVIGFITLIAASMWFAAYSTRYVPSVVTRLGAAAVYLGSVFTPAQDPSISVVPTLTASSTIISFGGSSPATSTSTDPKPTHNIPTTAGPQTTTVSPIGGATTTEPFVGLPDFIVTITAVGYLATTSAESFIATSTVPANSRVATTFTIKNAGGSPSGAWRFSASIPTQSFFVYQSQPQQSLNPGDSIEYVLGFDQAIPGADKMISVSANFDHAVTESNFENNSASSKVTVLGS